MGYNGDRHMKQIMCRWVKILQWKSGGSSSDPWFCQSRGFQNCDGKRLLAKKSVKDGSGPIHQLIFSGKTPFFWLIVPNLIMTFTVRHGKSTIL